MTRKIIYKASATYIAVNIFRKTPNICSAISNVMYFPERTDINFLCLLIAKLRMKKYQNDTITQKHKQSSTSRNG